MYTIETISCACLEKDWAGDKRTFDSFRVEPDCTTLGCLFSSLNSVSQVMGWWRESCYFMHISIDNESDRCQASHSMVTKDSIALNSGAPVSIDASEWIAWAAEKNNRPFQGLAFCFFYNKLLRYWFHLSKDRNWNHQHPSGPFPLLPLPALCSSRQVRHNYRTKH